MAKMQIRRIRVEKPGNGVAGAADEGSFGRSGLRMTNWRVFCEGGLE
jgi:hypothetical protein